MKEMLEIDAAAGSVWRHRDLRRAALARGAGWLGDEVAAVALVLTAYDAGWGSAGVGAVLVVAALPVALGAPLAGRVVDRLDSRRATTRAAAVQAAAALALAVLLAVADVRSVAVAVAALALVLVVGAGQAVAGPAWQALVPHLVPRAEVSRAVAALQGTTTLAGVAGPAVGGALVAVGGPAWALLVDAASFAAVAVLGRAVRVVRRPAPAAPGGVWAGFAALRADRLLGAVVAGLVAVVAVLQAAVVLDVALARDVLGAGPAGYGAVNAGFALAMVAGTVLAGTLLARGRDGGGRPGRQERRQVAGVLAGAAGISAGVVAGGLAPSLGWLAAALAAMGLSNGLLSVCFGALLAVRVPDAVRGRVLAAVSGATQTASTAGLALGGLLGGVVAPRAGWLLAGGAGLVVTAVVTVTVRRAGAPTLT